MDNNTLKKYKMGLLFAFLTVFFDAFYDVGARIATLAYDIKPMVFVSLVYIGSAVALLAYAQAGRLGIETFKSTQTWVFSFLNAMLTFIYLGIFQYITSTEANMIVRITVPMIFLYHVFICMHKPKAVDSFSALLITIAYVILIAGLDPESRAPVIGLGLCYAVILTIRAIVSERHPESNEAKTSKEEARVTGVIMLATGYIFMLLALLGAFLKSGTPNIEQTMPFLSGALPSYSDFSHVETIIAALIIGICFETPSMVFLFKAVKRVKSETYLQISALLPMMTLIVELSAYALGLSPVDSLDLYDFVAIVLITMAGFSAMIFKRIYGDVKEIRETTQNDQTDYDIAKKAVSFCKNDMIEASKKLGVGLGDLEKVLSGKGKRTFEVDHDTYRLILRNYHRNIANSDAMTGLPDQDTFHRTLAGALEDKTKFSVLFIDLNKFKPINDTYGHEVGNDVLKEIAMRLINASPNGAVIARYGGDEFITMLRYADREEAAEVMRNIKQEIMKPILIENINAQVSVGASIGISVAYEDGHTIKELIEHADSAMYKDKKNSGEER